MDRDPSEAMVVTFDPANAEAGPAVLVTGAL